MAYDERPLKPHHIILEGREKMSLSGVEDVESFDEQSIIMHTTKGTLTITGQDLHIGRLSIEGGEVDVEGFVDSLKYSEEHTAKGGLFARLFK